MSKLDAFRDRIAEWKARHWSDRAISDHLLLEFGVDISPTAICHYRLRHDMRVGMGRKGLKLTPIQIGRLQRAHRDGVTWDDLELRFGISRPTVAKYLKAAAASTHSGLRRIQNTSAT